MGRFILSMLLLFGFFRVSGQQSDPEIPENWNGITFQQLADSLNTKLNFQLFFKDEWIRNDTFKVAKTGLTLSVALSNSLYGSSIVVKMLPGRNILLSPGISIQDTFRFADLSFNKNPDVLIKSKIESVQKEETSQSRNGSNHNQINIGKQGKNAGQTSAILSGLVLSKSSGEPIIGATIYDEAEHTGTVTGSNGNYFIRLKKGIHPLLVRCIGMKELSFKVNLLSDGELNIEMEEQLTELRPVIVTSAKHHNIEGSQMGFNKVDSRMITRLPVIGEADVLKVALLLPGVQSVGEGTTGFNVRGGNADQNLILIDHAPVYNPSHLMGFFSAITADIIREYTLYKSVVPASMGGRLSSVLDLSLRNGNKSTFSGMGGISPLTSKLVLEGPVVKEKCSFLLSTRTTYSNWILHQINNEEIRTSEASFRDINGKVKLDLNSKNSLSFSGYYSSDQFSRHKKDTLFYYNNRAFTIHWTFRISPRLIMTNELINSRYSNTLSDSAARTNAYTLSYRIDNTEHRCDFTLFTDHGHNLNFGLSDILYALNPGELNPAGPNSKIRAKGLPMEKALLTSVYLADEFKLSERIQVNAGLRFSGYFYLGPAKVFNYTSGLPKEISTITDTMVFTRGNIVAPYGSPEPRISVRILDNNSGSVKIGYTRMRQYLHIMSNSFSIAPTDVWKLSDKHIRPQTSDQFSAGYYKNFRNGNYETSIEVYYKRLQGLKDYKVAAELSLNDHLETEILDCEGRAYGIELLIKKTAGKLNGWFSYTYSRIQERSNGLFIEEQINNNKWFPASYDKPHSFSIVGNYRFSRRISISSDLVYSSGRPVTYPVARYIFRENSFLHYSSRNEYRLADYFRWDASVNLEGNLRLTQFAHSFWSFSIYNITGRDNPYSVYFISKGNKTQGYQLSIFARPVLSLTYNFKF